MNVGQLKCSLPFCPTRHPTTLRVNRCPVGFFNHLACTPLARNSIPNHLVKAATISDSSSLLHFHFSNSRSGDASGIYMSHRILHLGERICEHLKIQLKSRIFTVFDVFMTRCTTWELPLSAELLWSDPKVRSHPCPFSETTTALRARIVIVVGDYDVKSAVTNKWFSCWCDQGLGESKNNLGPNHVLSPRVWTRIIGNPRLIYVTGNRW